MKYDILEAHSASIFRQGKHLLQYVVTESSFI
jgi:hypothetical protein